MVTSVSTENLTVSVKQSFDRFSTNHVNITSIFHTMIVDICILSVEIVRKSGESYVYMLNGVADGNMNKILSDRNFELFNFLIIGSRSIRFFTALPLYLSLCLFYSDFCYHWQASYVLSWTPLNTGVSLIFKPWLTWAQLNTFSDTTLPEIVSDVFAIVHPWEDCLHTGEERAEYIISHYGETAKCSYIYSK